MYNALRAIALEAQGKFKACGALVASSPKPLRLILETATAADDSKSSVRGLL